MRPEKSALAEKSCASVAPVCASGTFPSLRRLFNSFVPCLRRLSMGGFGIWRGVASTPRFGLVPQLLMVELRAGPDFAGVRLDKFLRKKLSSVPVSHLFKM